jgi:hypothetical protein
MNDETRLRQRMREYVADGPGQPLSFESVVAAGRRSRRRRQVAGASCLAVGALVAGSLGGYALSGSDTTDGQAPTVAGTPTQDDRTGDRKWTIDEILSRPLTEEERRIGERISANMEALLPASAEVSFKRMDRLSTTGKSGNKPWPPYVEFYVTVETNREHHFYFTSWSRNPDHVESPDLELCEDPVVYCADTDAGQVVALDGAGEYQPEGATADGELGAVVYGTDTGLMTLAFSQSARSWEPDPDTLALFTTEQLGHIVSDADLWMRDGTEGIDPRAIWTAPPVDPGTSVDIADLQQEIREAFAAGVQDRIVAGDAEPGEIKRRGGYYGGSHPDDAVEVDVEVDADPTTEITGIFTRGDATPADSLDCDDYRWGGQTCREVEINDGVILVTRSGHVDYDQDLGQQDMEVILVRDDGTGMRLTQYNFDPDDASSPGSAFPLTENDAVSLVQDPSLDYRG